MIIEELDVGTPNQNGANEEGIIVDYKVPCRWDVCGTCEGRGKIVNPSIDENGISPEEFLEDPDFEESYFDGVYDITCPGCGGRTTVEVADAEKILNPVLKKAVEDHIEADAEYEAQRRHEQKMGY